MPTVIEKIVSRDIPAVIVFENDSLISFIDNKPINEGHLLICPKNSYANIYDLPDELLIEIMLLAKNITANMVNNLNIDGVTLMQNNADLNTLNHFHLHLIPRFKNDSLSADNIRLDELSLDKQLEIKNIINFTK